MTSMERALREAIKKAGGLSALALATGMSGHLSGLLLGSGLGDGGAGGEDRS
jgi:hypothetical protein